MPTQQEIERVIRTAEQAPKDTNFANSIVIDSEQIEGTRYKFLISNAVSE